MVMYSISLGIVMDTNEPTDAGKGFSMPQHWQRLSAKIAQVGDRIAREIRNKLVASGVDPRSLDNPEGSLAPDEEVTRITGRNRRPGGQPPGYRPIG
jgi:hypothetical protein